MGIFGVGILMILRVAKTTVRKLRPTYDNVSTRAYYSKTGSGEEYYSRVSRQFDDAPIYTM